MVEPDQGAKSKAGEEPAPRARRTFDLFQPAGFRRVGKSVRLAGQPTVRPAASSTIATWAGPRTIYK